MSSGPAIFASLFYLVIPIVMLVAGILAHRGKPFWATWLMLIGSIGLFIAIVVMAAGLYFAFQNLGGTRGGASSSSAMGGANSGAILSLFGGLLIVGSLISYGVGLIALCARWGPTARRAAELEELTTSLLSERSQSQAG